MKKKMRNFVGKQMSMNKSKKSLKLWNNYGKMLRVNNFANFPKLEKLYRIYKLY